jgi:hypothetical protein
MKHIKTYESFIQVDQVDEGFFRDSPEEKFEKFKREAMKYVLIWTEKGYNEPDWDQIKIDAENDKYRGRIGTDGNNIVYIIGDKAGFEYGAHVFGGNS